MSELLAGTAFAGGGALNVSFPRFCLESSLFGYDNVAAATPRQIITKAEVIRSHKPLLNPPS